MEIQNIQNQPDNHPPFKQDFALEIKNLIQDTLKGSYQLKMALVFLLISFTTNLESQSTNLLYMNPVFNCQGLTGKVTEERACQNIGICSIVNAQTVTAQLQLYCGPKTDERVMIQSAAGIGRWLGLIFVAIISDRKGRRFSFIFSMIVLVSACLVSLIGITTKSTVLLVISQVLEGFSARAIYFSFLILCTRFLKKQSCEAVSIYWLIISGIAEMMIAVINEHFKSWRSLIYIYSVGNIAATILIFIILYQDPIYYFDTAQYDDCKEVFKGIGIQNGESQEQIQAKIAKIDSYIQIKHQSEAVYQIQEGSFSITDLIKCDIIVNILVLATLQCILNMAASSLDLSIQSLKLSFDQNILIIGGAKIVGNLLSIWLLRIEENRRRGFVLSGIICGLAAIMFVFKFCIDSSLVQTIALVVLRIGLCWNNNFYVRLKIDYFPEKYQGTLVGCVQVINFGKIIAPFVAQFSIKQHLNPMVSINLLKLTLGTMPIFFLKEQKLKTKQNEKEHKAKIED